MDFSLKIDERKRRGLIEKEGHIYKIYEWVQLTESMWNTKESPINKEHLNHSLNDRKPGIRLLLGNDFHYLLHYKKCKK